jgi:glycosyltransferase involved in cell wall biosynthesis
VTDPRVVHVLAGAGVGGTERQLLLLLPELAASVDTRLVVIRGGPLTERLAAVVPTEQVAKYGKVDPVFLARLVARLRRHQPDIVHTWGTTANVWASVAARLAGVPHLVTTEGALDPWKGPLHRGVDRRVYRWADAVVCNSATVADHLRRLGADRSVLRVIPNGIPETAGRDGFLPAQPHIVFLGRLHPVKGPDLLVEALPRVLARIPDAIATIAGPAAQKAERDCAAQLRRELVRLGLHDTVSMPGLVEEPAKFLRHASVLAVPSRSEGSPNVVLEAMAVGVPVVAADVGGVSELVRDGETGWLVPPNDPSALADALVDALGHPAEAQRRAATAMVASKRYALHQVVGEWLGLYRSLNTSSRG